jgi:hypothetical protein
LNIIQRNFKNWNFSFFIFERNKFFTKIFIIFQIDIIIYINIKG